MFTKKILSQSTVLAGGAVVNSIFGLVFYVLVARFLGPSDFGYFSYILGLGVLAAELCDMGLNVAIIKYGSGSEINNIFKYAVRLRIISFLAITIIFFIVSLIWGSDYFYSAIVAISTLLWYFGNQFLLSRQKYFWQVFATAGSNGARLLLALFITLTPHNVLLLYCFGAIGTFLISIIPLHHYFVNPFRGSITKQIEIIRFSIPSALSYFLSSAAAKIDTPMIFNLAGSYYSGIYASAQKLSSAINTVIGAVDGVFSPKHSNRESKILKVHFSLAVLMSFGLIIVILPANGLIVLLFGEKYLDVVPVFNLIVLGFIPFILSGPFAAKVTYYWGKSKINAIAALFNLIITTSLYLILIPIHKASGAAYAFIISNTIMFLVYATSFAYYRSHNR